MDNLGSIIKDVVFEAKVLDKYRTFDWIANRSMEDLGYTYLHSDLLDSAILTTNHSQSQITSYRFAWVVFAKKTCLWRSKKLALSQSPKGDWKYGMHVVIIIESIPLCHQSLFLN
jgi:hypothetical protein